MRIPTLRLTLAFALACLCHAADEVQPASFNSAGALTSLVANGREIPVEAYLEVVYPGVVKSLQPHDQSTPVTRKGIENRWSAAVSFPNEQVFRMEASWDLAGNRAKFKGVATAGSEAAANEWVRRRPFAVDEVAYVISLPREVFEGWILEETGAPLPDTATNGVIVHTGKASGLRLVSPDKAWTLACNWGEAREVQIRQTWQRAWQRSERTYEVRVTLHKGSLNWDDQVPVSAEFSLSGSGRAADVAVAPTGDPAYPYDGFGANFCFNTDTPSIEFLEKRLPLAWARYELKAFNWLAERNNPGPALKRDFELMQRAEKAGLPWALSIWRLPETFYANPNQVRPGTFGRRIAEDKWPEFLELVSSFILYVRDNYGAEPDYFSFNEPDLGVDVGFTAETHRDAIKRIGKHLESKGIKTKQLLGDTANPRDTHLYTLPTAMDPEAMAYVGAVSFHSWFAASPAQYKAWADVAKWVGRPLIVGEAGLDPGAYRNKSFDSYSYGLREIAHLLEILRDTQARSLLYWQYTEDYGLVRVEADKRITETGRFRLMEQLVANSPKASESVPLKTSEPDTWATAFRKDNRLVVHVLNRGLARSFSLDGLGQGTATVLVTTEETSSKSSQSIAKGARIDLPARSLVTLVFDGR